VRLVLAFSASTHCIARSLCACSSQNEGIVGGTGAADTLRTALPPEISGWRLYSSAEIYRAQAIRHSNWWILQQRCGADNLATPKANLIPGQRMTHFFFTCDARDVGLSTAGLARLGLVMQGEVDAGRVPGAVRWCAAWPVGILRELRPRDPPPARRWQRTAFFRIYSMTKPIVSVAAMMLWNRALPAERPIEKYLPELGERKVAVAHGAKSNWWTPSGPSPFKTCCANTSGLTYEFRGSGPGSPRCIWREDLQPQPEHADQVATWAGCPSSPQPGAGETAVLRVLGRLVEVLRALP